MASAAKLAKLVRRKAKLEREMEKLRGDLEACETPDGRARIVIDIRRTTDHYARLLRRLEQQ